MKTLTAALAIAATSFAVSAVPAFAADNAAYEQRAELQRLIDEARARNNPVVSPAPVTVTQKRVPRGAVISTTMPSGPERALMRLRAVQPVPAGR